MSERCWVISCWNYGRDRDWCLDDHDEPRGGQRGSEAGCYS